MNDPNKFIGSIFVWEPNKVKEIMQDIVDFTKNSDSHYFPNKINHELRTEI